MDWLVWYYFLISVSFVTVIADAGHVKAIYGQQDERIRLECIVSSRLDAEEAMWMRIRQPHNPDILTYRDSVVYAPDRIQLEQRRLSSSINANGALVDTYFLTLTLLRSNIDDEGRYVCSRGKNVFAEYDLSIIVPSQFVEDDNFNQQRTIREGSTLQLFCSATGRPQPSITWSYRATDGKHISLADGLACNDTVCELRLENYTRNDPNIIECVADNEKSTRISKIFNVDVHYPPKLTTNTQTYTRAKRIDIIIQCSSIANPPASILWLDDTKRELNHSHIYDIKTINHTSTLSFSVFPYEHSLVMFYCHANNSIGSDEKSINISDFIQFDSIMIRETTTVSSETTTIDSDKLFSKKQKTLRPTRARSRVSTSPIPLTSPMQSLSSSSNSFIYSFASHFLNFILIFFVSCFV
ncbi:unnamed protein product [Adineta ricciae]|uniref:Ig-like domain-containing protein n=1 Tax=Adineta ricciae TaxID=249248 RepID=A0A814ZY42_ADIRI|nr:unnamed protein product [Adineta ricciae]CAF1590590.1 unnamed protein product [Adineta ricciae]